MEFDMKINNNEVIIDNQFIGRINGLKLELDLKKGALETDIKSLKKADGLVVGSAICKEISKSIEKRQNAVTNVTNIVKRLKNKIQ